MAGLIDSEAAFTHRLLELRFTEAEREALKKQDLVTFAALAFAASVQPGQIDETKFAALVQACFGSADATVGQPGKLRHAGRWRCLQNAAPGA